MGNVENLRKAVILLERLKEFVSLKSESACQVRREAFRFLVKYLGLLNEVRKYGIHGSLEEPLRQLEYLANKSKTKDLGAYVTLDRDITQPKLSDGERLSFIDQLNLWANKIEGSKDPGRSKYTPEKIKNMQTSFNNHFDEDKGVKHAWECVAEEHGLKNGKAAEMAVRRHLKQNK